MASAPDSTLTRLARTNPHAPVMIAGSVGLAVALAVLLLIGDRAVATGFVGAGLLIGVAFFLYARIGAARDAEPVEVDWSVARALAQASPHALAVTDRAGRFVCANDAFARLFPGYPAPPGLPVGDVAAAALARAGRAAWRDGEGDAGSIDHNGRTLAATIARAGDEMLVWRFEARETVDVAAEVERLIGAETGDRLGGAGVMAVTLTPDGRIRAANRVFRTRAMGHSEAAMEGREFGQFLRTDSAGLIRFDREGDAGNPLRLLQLPFVEGDTAPMLVALIDDEERVATPALDGDAAAHVRSLISLLPAPLALVDREGRFLHMNDAFFRAATIDAKRPPLYPGDLVVREDKAALSDAIRRFANGAAHTADMAIRLKHHPDETVNVTIAGARGLGEAAVLLSIHDKGEETRLKRQVAQATKMQAVGQLAGGVAHDFNNILTAIIGHCDLMLMRHSPGDSDYDDIQQIRANSNRAASLTRQLLAFSRQQTLRPQVLQLPDVISEVSNLLKRLLGETVKLEVKHGRGLGSVRADPGQLEQVIVNLAVNARDAMLTKNPSGGGTLTIETCSLAATKVRDMADDVLPLGDYTALIVTDTGTGIPPDALPKIFEPFYTTKEVGKGTGLGLSTVYGIVKQSGGYIFAENVNGGGARFTIYFPVHSAVDTPVKPVHTVRVATGAVWGTGTILLVEDEDMVRAVAERALSRQGYSVVTAEHGEAALEWLEQGTRPDLLISDVVMPIMDGPTMVAQARKRYPDLPVLFMSGYAEEQLRRSIDLDNVEFLPKPFSVQQLAEAARDVLNAK